MCQIFIITLLTSLLTVNETETTLLIKFIAHHNYHLLLLLLQGLAI